MFAQHYGKYAPFVKKIQSMGAKNESEVEQDLKKYLKLITPDVCYICAHMRVQKTYIFFGEFEKSRKAFNYGELNQTLYSLSQGQ